MDVSRCKENFGMTLTIILIAAITVGLLKRRNHNPVAQQLVRQLPEFIDAVVLLMFSGSTPAQALIAAPTWLEPPPASDCQRRCTTTFSRQSLQRMCYSSAWPYRSASVSFGRGIVVGGPRWPIDRQRS